MLRTIIGLAAFVVCLSAQAFADDPTWTLPADEMLKCREKADSDTEFNVELKNVNNVMVAKLQQWRQSRCHCGHGRFIKLAELKCVAADSDNLPPDAPTPLLKCFDPSVVDSGYIIELVNEGVTGKKSVKVSEQTIAGPKQIAAISCKIAKLF